MYRLKLQYPIIGVCGRYFSGKTIVANIISSVFQIPYIIHSDIVRITLSFLIDSEILRIPTYMLSEEGVEKQFSIISNYIIKISNKLCERGESHIIEGLHFSNKLIDYIIKKQGLIIYIMNILPLEYRIAKKSTTRRRLRSSEGVYINVNNINNPQETAYYNFIDNIIKIDEKLDNLCINKSNIIIKINKELRE